MAEDITECKALMSALKAARAPKEPAAESAPEGAGNEGGSAMADTLTAGQVAEMAAQAATEAVNAAFEARDGEARKAREKAERKAAKKAAKEAAKPGQGATAETAPAAPAVTEKSVDDLVTERLQEMVASGAISVGRAGLAGLNEHRVPGKEGGPEALDPEALRKLDSDSLADYAGAALDQHVYGRRGLAVHS